jgi:hypothetical protein
MYGGVLCREFLLAAVPEVWIPALKGGVWIIIERVDPDLQ